MFNQKFKRIIKTKFKKDLQKIICKIKSDVNSK